jgi:RNA polymerase sigma-B factor
VVSIAIQIASRFERGAPRTAAGFNHRAHEDRRLLRRYQDEGDLNAREELVERFLPLARQLARRYRHTDEPQEDLTQVACVGLLKAIDRYEPERGSSFTRYAVPTILGELKRHFRDQGWAVHVPRALQERALQVNQAVSTLSARLGRSPTAQEIARAIEADPEEVLEAMEAATAYGASSLDAPRPGSDEDEGRTYGDTVASEEEGYELVAARDAVLPGLRALPPRERVIVHLRFERDLTQAEIAERVGVSQMHVSRLLRRSLERLRASASSDGQLRQEAA